VTTYDTRAQLGSSDAPAEDQLSEAFDTIVSEGAQRLHRSWREVLSTGLAGGLEVATGVLALLAVLAETGSHLLAGLAFSIGFIALLLARSELSPRGSWSRSRQSSRGGPRGRSSASSGAARWSRTSWAAGW